jgi:hypothetical protein
MQNGTWELMHGEVEADETYIGANAKFMHAEKRERVLSSYVKGHKIAVFGTLQRGADEKHSLVRTKVLRTADTAALRDSVREHVHIGSYLYTDAHHAYKALGRFYRHESVSHVDEYVRGRVHTNGLESFWSLVKRTIRGTYVAIDPFHLFRYLDEQSFRFNNREDNDSGRFVSVLKDIIGRRLTYSELTGRELYQT